MYIYNIYIYTYDYIYSEYSFVFTHFHPNCLFGPDDALALSQAAAVTLGPNPGPGSPKNRVPNDPPK